MTPNTTDPDRLDPGLLRRQLLAMTRGDGRAAREVWSALAPRLVALARSVLGDHHAAEDAVQDALCRVIGSKRRDLRRLRDPEAWLFVLVRNASIDRLRRAKPRAELGEASVEQPEPTPELASALAQLPPEQREVVTLRHASGLTFDRLAEALAVPRSTLADRYAAGITNLRAALCDEEKGASRCETQPTNA